MMQIRFQNSDAGVESGGPHEDHVIAVPPGRPGPYVQLTYEGLRVTPDGEHIAVYQDGYWRLTDGSERFYSDVVIGCGEA